MTDIDTCACPGCNECENRLGASTSCLRRSRRGHPFCAACGGSPAFTVGRTIGIVVGLLLVIGLVALHIWLRVLFVRWAVS